MKKKREIKFKRSSVIMLSLSIACLFIAVSPIPKAFARYITSFDAGTAEISVARPIVTIKITDITETIDPQNTLNVNFVVTNFDSTENKNEIALEYYLTFSNYGTDMTLPITYTLKDNNGQSINLDSSNKTTEAKEATVYRDSGESHEYQLTLTWDETASKNYTYADIINTLNIVANVKQKIS